MKHGTLPLRLLLVEDCLSDAELTVRLLEKAGHAVQSERVETAQAMQAALAKQEWDIIIADYHLPQFNAPAALEVLRTSGLELPFIVVSGAVGEDLAVAMMKSGAQDYLMKSNLTRLAPAVERELHEARIRREQKQADRLLDAVFAVQPDAVLVHNTAGALMQANPAASQMRLPAEITAGTRRALAGETVAHVEQAEGDRILETYSIPLRDAGRIIGAVTIVRDVTEKKRAEERLRQAHKLESIALLAGGIAHDFNNILTVVSGNIALALEDCCPDCGMRAVLPDALESLQRAGTLTRQLLAYAGKGGFERKPVSVSEAGRQSAGAVLPSIPSRIRLLTEFEDGLPPLIMDPGQMEQVFTNLILNAVESMPEDVPGTICVRTARHQENICIEVSDNGCGMDADTQKRIFDPFFTTKFAGRGLGLSAVEGIARALGGSIAVESTVGEGTRIRVLLPVQPVSGTAPPAPLQSPPADGGSAVLIVDDEPMIRKMARVFLKKHGITVLEAANGKEAIEQLTHGCAEVRAVVLDMEMPEMSGDAAVPLIHQLRPDIQIIVSSGYQERGAQQHLNQIHDCRFLPKPYSPDQLLAEVLSAIRRSEKVA